MHSVSLIRFDLLFEAKPKELQTFPASSCLSLHTVPQ